jgi:hypothetical protein
MRQGWAAAEVRGSIFSMNASAIAEAIEPFDSDASITKISRCKTGQEKPKH